MSVNLFFATPVFIKVDVNHEKNMSQLKNEIYKMQEDDVGIVRSNQGGWHSDSNIFRKTEPGIKRVCNLVRECINDCTTEIAPDFQIDYQKLELKCEGWVNVNPQHSFNVPHDHPGYTWSCVYYVQVPNTKGSRSGMIEFLDPRTCVAANASDIYKDCEHFTQKRKIKPENGMIIIFPAYLKHWVYPNAEDEDRITFAFNFKFVKKREPSSLNMGPKAKKNNSGTTQR